MKEFHVDKKLHKSKNFLICYAVLVLNFLTPQKADNKIFVCKFSKNVKSKLYHIENSKTRGQTV